MLKRKVLFISQEIYPYIHNTPISNICKDIPYGIQEKGKEIRLFMPKFGNINERRNQLHEVIRLSGLNIIINDFDHPLLIKVATMPSSRIQVYFIDNDEYFQNRLSYFNKEEQFYDNNDERAIFFARGIIETVKNLGWSPDIIHCNGWFSHLLPLYLKKIYKDHPLFADTKVVFTLYNDDFSEKLDEDFISKLKFDGFLEKDLKHFANPDYINTMKAAIDYSDGIIISSQDINIELKSYAALSSQPIIYHNPEENLLSQLNEFYDELIEKNVLV